MHDEEKPAWQEHCDEALERYRYILSMIAAIPPGRETTAAERREVAIRLAAGAGIAHRLDRIDQGIENLEVMAKAWMDPDSHPSETKWVTARAGTRKSSTRKSKASPKKPPKPEATA